MSILSRIAEEAHNHYGERLAGAPKLAQDALTLELDTGVVVQVRFASAEDYSIQWRRGDAELRIDTAPLHRNLSTFPNHLHGPDGTTRSDPLTEPGREPWHNLRAVLDAILANPLL